MRKRGKDGRFTSHDSGADVRIAPDLRDATEGLGTITTANGSLKRVPRKGTRFDAGRRKHFLDALGMTCNVRDSARKAGVSSCTPYYRRGVDRDFAAAWDAALDEGHELLTLEMLHRARFGTRSKMTERDAGGVKKEVEKIDFRDSVGLSLLTRYDKKKARGSSAAAADPGDADARHDALVALLWAAEREDAPANDGDA